MASNVRAHFQLWFSPPALRSYVAEFISTFLFVFATIGSAISARMLTPDITSDASSLVATALAQGFALFVAVYIAADASGGHVNPAVTFALAIGSHVSVPTAIFYWVSQLLGATVACLILRVASAGQAIPTTRISTEMTGFGGAVLESVTTFALVYTVHVACDLRGGVKRGPLTSAALGPIAVGLAAGACVLATGSLTGASMNPARSFGPAIISGDFKNHGVYWVGPLIGAALAALVHQNLVYPSVSPSSDPPRGNLETATL
ncbi:probable aquaporin TIP5-1 [Typha angustifolia]|uniref:probable aquaporin TIP5-1 n=1 Tax=Typha angustifolia TaxID=59011 RepID=UPI003C2F7118